MLKWHFLLQWSRIFGPQSFNMFFSFWELIKCVTRNDCGHPRITKLEVLSQLINIKLQHLKHKNIQGSIFCEAAQQTCQPGTGSVPGFSVFFSSLSISTHIDLYSCSYSDTLSRLELFWFPALILKPPILSLHTLNNPSFPDNYWMIVLPFSFKSTTSGTHSSTDFLTYLSTFQPSWLLTDWSSFNAIFPACLLPEY